MEVRVSRAWWISALRLPGDQALVVSLALLVRVDVDPNVADPLWAAGHQAPPVQRVLIQLTHPPCNAQKKHQVFAHLLLQTPAATTTQLIEAFPRKP